MPVAGWGYYVSALGSNHGFTGVKHSTHLTHFVESVGFAQIVAEAGRSKSFADTNATVPHLAHHHRHCRDLHGLHWSTKPDRMRQTGVLLLAPSLKIRRSTNGARLEVSLGGPKS